MSTEKERVIQEEKDWGKVDEAVITSGSFVMKYRNQLLIGLAAVIVIVGIYYAYQAFYVAPKTLDAQAAMFKGEQYFQVGQDSLALYGDGNGYVGFEAIINEYSSTKTGDLAKAYAGLSYARLGNYERALSYLKDYSGGDLMITPSIKGAIGDCLVNTGQVSESVSYFENAAKSADDILLSPLYYKKAAMVYRDLKNYDKVIEMFTLIQNNYIASPEAADAEKYILEATMLKQGSN